MQVGNYVLPRLNTHARIRTELIINAGKHQRLPRRDTHAWIRTELITNAGEYQRLPRVHVGNQLCPDPGVRVSPRESLMLEREQAPTLLMSMEIVYVRTCVRAYVRPRPRPTARLRMCEIGISHISKCLRHLRRLF